MGTKRFKVQMRVSKGFKRFQTMNKGLIKDPSSHDSNKDLFILMNEFEQESHERESQNKSELLL